MAFDVLVINPGSTSTKIAVFHDNACLFNVNITHEASDLAPFDKIIDQFEFRYELVHNFVLQQDYDPNMLSAVVGRGGLIRPVSSGTYLVSPLMIKDLEVGYAGQHASNLGGLIAAKIGRKYRIPAFIVDPVVVDEMAPLARFSGTVCLERHSKFHALNQKAVARLVAHQLNRDYSEMQFVVAHLGGGISIAAHCFGKVIDVNNALGGDGPFSPDRAGSVPVHDFVNLVRAEDWPDQKIHQTLVGQGGVMSYLNTNDLREVELAIAQGDEKAALVFEAMAYQVSKEIGAYAAVLKGQADGIILTGGLANSELFINRIKVYISWIAPIYVVPGENEMVAMNDGAQRVLRKEEPSLLYGEELATW